MGRDNFYTAVAFQRGGVPLARMPVRTFQVATEGFARYVPAHVQPNPSALGWTPDYIPGFGYTKTGLQNRGANVSTYDHAAITKTVLSARIGASDIEAYPGYVQFVAVASNDSAALLKTAYWLAVAADATGSESLRLAAQQRNDAGVTAGVDIGAASRTSNIKSTYESAYRLLERTLGANPPAGVAADALEELRKGTDIKRIEARIIDARKSADDRKALADEPKKESGPTPCEETVLAYIPGYCAWKQTAETAARVAETSVRIGGVLLVAFVGYKLIQKAREPRRSNPRRNPVSEAYNPDGKTPMPAEATRQEARLAKTLFVKG